MYTTQAWDTVMLEIQAERGRLECQRDGGKNAVLIAKLAAAFAELQLLWRAQLDEDDCAILRPVVGMKV
jgi:hypothetical protein